MNSQKLLSLLFLLSVSITLGDSQDSTVSPQKSEVPRFSSTADALAGLDLSALQWAGVEVEPGADQADSDLEVIEEHFEALAADEGITLKPVENDTAPYLRINLSSLIGGGVAFGRISLELIEQVTVTRNGKEYRTVARTWSSRYSFGAPAEIAPYSNGLTLGVDGLFAKFQKTVKAASLPE